MLNKAKEQNIWMQQLSAKVTDSEPRPADESAPISREHNANSREQPQTSDLPSKAATVRLFKEKIDFFLKHH